MDNLQVKTSEGIMICRAKGEVDAEDFETWREHLLALVKSNKDSACGVLVDLRDLDNVTADALDAILEFLFDPQETLRDVRIRFALIGLKPFTQRFFRETLPIEQIKHLRARFFHEVAEGEALAWLQAMVDSAKDLPLPQKTSEPQPKKNRDDKQVAVIHRTDVKGVQAAPKNSASKPENKQVPPPSKPLTKHADPEKPEPKPEDGKLKPS